MLARLIAQLLERLRTTARRGRQGRASVGMSSQLREVRLRSCASASECRAACCARGVRIDKPEAERLVRSSGIVGSVER